ncbi:MAG: hypothetical protein QGH37_19560 [Candidatus Poribacteria bacterium]|jgi:septal ring factor EnvC (AmiA/AmiB activator)|nr:hypothetical protein [Candidatus Poribacteria bacterium]MDP6998777.1 hypothetical protein [Candidatus Poribacteria bacterium]
MIKKGNVFFKFCGIVKLSLFFIVCFIGCYGSQIDDLTKEKEELNSQIRGLKTKINEKEQSLTQEILAKEKIETDLKLVNTKLEELKGENGELNVNPDDLKANLDQTEAKNAI